MILGVGVGCADDMRPVEVADFGLGVPPTSSLVPVVDFVV